MNTTRIPIALVLLFGALVFATNSSAESRYEYTTRPLTGSPRTRVTLALPTESRVRDVAVSPLGPAGMVLLEVAGEPQILEADLLAAKTHAVKSPLASGELQAIAWHPQGEAVYLMGRDGETSRIWKAYCPLTGEWREIYQTKDKLNRLIATPARYWLYETPSTGSGRQFRLYFGVELEQDRWGIRSVTEHGKLPFNAFCPEKFERDFLPPPSPESYFETGNQRTEWALPVVFHPSGKELLWEDKDGDKHLSEYAQGWEGKQSFTASGLQESHVSIPPNGCGYGLWRVGATGLTVLLDDGNERLNLALELKFESAPRWLPDGRAIVGIVSKNGNPSLVLEPVDLPLGDIANAWMYGDSPRDRKRFVESGGYFHRSDLDQLAGIYEADHYGFDSMEPTRPFLVTTDVYWEVFAASYEGLFRVVENARSIPAFWEFVASANQYYSQRDAAAETRLKGIFATLNHLREGTGAEIPEVQKILASSGEGDSEWMGPKYSFENLKPRGSYTKKLALQTYFRAFGYLGSARFDEREKATLNAMPAALKDKARAFIQPYLVFIAPTRHPLILDLGAAMPGVPSFIKHPPQGSRIFPLSWGFDNEVLNSTVYHFGWPDNELITDREGKRRLLPDVLELPTALGSEYAETLLKSAGLFEQHPNLSGVMEDLKARWKKSRGKHPGIYAQWLEALAIQWADDVKPPPSGVSDEMWRAKRLQTGLASWTSLHHTTVLVNERSGAEAGEGGFEQISVEPPLGAVEPDPATFAAIAALFEAEIAMVREALRSDGERDLRDGLSRNLAADRNLVVAYREMALKQMAGKPLTPEEYESIDHIGGNAEHSFLLYKSLGQDDFAWSTPDPMTKIVDVAGNGPYLHAAIGRPAGWNLIVPHFGRRQVVKGAVYTFQPVVRSNIMTDEQWREEADNAAPVPWVEKFFLQTEAK